MVENIDSVPSNVQSSRQEALLYVFEDNVDFVPANVRFSHQEALLYVFEDNEAVIKMIIKGRSATIRHVSRTHRVALHWLFDQINLDELNLLTAKTNSLTF